MPLSSYWQPRHWPAWVGIGILRLTAALPWRFAIKLYKGVGLILWALLRSRRELVLRNIRMRFPERSQDEIRQLAKRHFQSLGACLAEVAYAWFGRVDDSLVSFRIEGTEHVFSALSAGRGVILYTGHFTSIEICGPPVKRLFPKVAILFHPRRNPLLNELQRRGRLHSGHISFADTNVRAMVNALRHEAVVWYASDQSHSHHAQQLRRKGGTPAMGDTTTCRIARISGAAVVPFSYSRLADDSGYLLRFKPALEDLPGNEDEAFARQLGSALQELIEECPEQYGWTYKRLRNPQGYAPDAPAESTE
jgi:KDO2-lipid IV(A) lauroyltransferase